MKSIAWVWLLPIFLFAAGRSYAACVVAECWRAIRGRVWK